MSSLKYWLWLTTRRGLPVGGAAGLLERFGTPEAVYYADGEEYALSGLPDSLRASLGDKALDGAEAILERCEALHLRLLTLGDAAYPDRLKNIPDPPAVLYLRGREIAFDDEVAIGVVGSRDPSEYGRQMAGKLGLELARGGAVVVSGIAQGLDTEALRGALKGGGTVVSVLGCGVDVCYPRENRWLYEDVAAAGALVSEYPPGTGALGGHFPVRNRIISGLSLGVVAVECALRSGTRITVSHALEQGRDVFAVPGNVDAPMSAGTNQLIREGAILVTSGQDILEEYADRYPGRVCMAPPMAPADEAARLQCEGQQEKKPVDKPTERRYIDLDDPELGLTDDQKMLLAALEEKKLLADDLVELTQIPAKRVLSALTMLQVRGLVQQGGGKRFEALVKTKQA